jgi:hypothetical protein
MEDKSDDTPRAAPSSQEGQRKRPAPTIDLPASDVTDTTEAAKPATETTADEPQSTSRARFSAWGSHPAQPDAATPESPSAATPVPAPSATKTILISALSGAAAALIIGGGWLALSSGPADQDTPSSQTVALDALNARITKLENKPVPSSTPRDDSALVNRLNVIENETATLRKDMAALRAQLESTTANVNALKSAPADVTPAQDLSGLEGRLSKLEQAAISPAAPQPVATVPQDDATLRRAVVATALDQAVTQGVPFTASLSEAEKLSGDTAALKSLAPFASTGVPTVSALTQDLLDRIKPLETERTAPPASANLVDRLRASAFSLVRVTRVDDKGTDRLALLARAKTAAQRGDIAESQKLVTQLPEADRVKLQPWIEKADARAAALAASRQFAQDAAATLSRPASASQ